MHIKDKINRYRAIKNSIEQLNRKYANMPIILAGDFSYNNLSLARYGFKDTYKGCARQKYTNTVITNMQRRLDYIFIKNLSCLPKSHHVLQPLEIGFLKVHKNVL